MANIKDKIENIRKAVFGKDVRGSLADGLDAVNKETESTTSKQEHLEDTFDQLIINAGNSNAEIVDARVDKNNGNSYKSLGERMDAGSAQMEDMVQYVETKIGNMSTQPYINDKATKKDINDANANLLFSNVFQGCELALSSKGVLNQYMIDGNRVQSWKDQSKNSFLAGIKATQNLIANQPALIKNIPFCMDIVKLPDVEFGQVGKGFTCTGLTYDKNEKVFYVGNIGKALPTATGFKSTIVKLSKDFKTNLGEIKLYTTFPTMSDIQGITIDYSDNSFWLCSFTENKIRQISKKGVNLGMVDINSPSGIAYDNRTDSLWVLTNSDLKNIKKDGTILKTIPIALVGQDQLWLDEINSMMYITAGNDYSNSSYVYKVNLEDNKIELAYTLKESYAIEGIYIDNGIMYILNDGYYHSGTIAINQMNKYDINKLINSPQFDNLNDCLEVTNNSYINNLKKFSISAIVQITGDGGEGVGRIFEKINGTNGYNLTYKSSTNSLAIAQYRTGSISGWETSFNSVYKGSAFHLVFVFDRTNEANNPELYVNGVKLPLTVTAIGSGSFTDDTGIALLLGNKQDLTKGLNGFIFEFHVFNNIMSSNGVSELYTAMREYYRV